MYVGNVTHVECAKRSSVVLSYVTSRLTLQVQDALQQADVVLAGALVSGGRKHCCGDADHSE
jgi:hypothetical protein